MLGLGESAYGIFQSTPPTLFIYDDLGRDLGQFPMAGIANGTGPFVPAYSGDLLFWGMPTLTHDGVPGAGAVAVLKTKKKDKNPIYTGNGHGGDNPLHRGHLHGSSSGSVPSANDNFGFAIAAASNPQGNTHVVISAPGDLRKPGLDYKSPLAQGLGDSAGALFVFGFVAEQASFLAVLKPPTTVSRGFGTSVGIAWIDSQTYLIAAGNPYAGANTGGTVSLFQPGGAAGDPTTGFLADIDMKNVAGAEFGRSLQLTTDGTNVHLVIGAPGDSACDPNPWKRQESFPYRASEYRCPNSGSVHGFVITGGKNVNPKWLAIGARGSRLGTAVGVLPGANPIYMATAPTNPTCYGTSLNECPNSGAVVVWREVDKAYFPFFESGSHSLIGLGTQAATVSRGFLVAAPNASAVYTYLSTQPTTQ